MVPATGGAGAGAEVVRLRLLRMMPAMSPRLISWRTEARTTISTFLALEPFLYEARAGIFSSL